MNKIGFIEDWLIPKPETGSFKERKTIVDTNDSHSTPSLSVRSRIKQISEIHIGNFIRSAVQKKRPFDACQWAGFSLILIAVSIWVHPVSLPLSWFNQWIGIDVSVLAWAAIFGVFGWILAWQHALSHSGFFILTLPILMFAVTQILFAMNIPGAGYSSGIGTGILYSWMQWAHARQEAHRAFMHSIGSEL